MVITDRLKQLIFKQLYKELGNVEIIPYNGSVWFIDRENSYWYFHLSEQGCLYWRYSFFPSFFSVFSLEQSEFEPIISSWVEEVLNNKAPTTIGFDYSTESLMEEVLNSKVSTTLSVHTFPFASVEEVLNHKVSTTRTRKHRHRSWVEEVLNHKVSETFEINSSQKRTVKKVLNHKVCTTDVEMSVMNYVMEQVLNQ